uniref:tRNA-guanine(15) transglycosylase-like domain-containing protein n=1 Tax=Chenopodium quinoa TaxID=63459 RepID=A0A803LUS9_CHEQI
MFKMATYEPRWYEREVRGSFQSFESDEYLGIQLMVWLADLGHCWIGEFERIYGSLMFLPRYEEMELHLIWKCCYAECMLDCSGLGGFFGVGKLEQEKRSRGSVMRHPAEVAGAFVSLLAAYVQGCGYPLDIIICSALGVDMYDCVYSTCTARFGTASANLFCKILLGSRLFSYCKVAAGGLVVAGFAKLASFREGSGNGMFQVREWFKNIRGKGSENN